MSKAVVVADKAKNAIVPDDEADWEDAPECEEEEMEEEEEEEDTSIDNDEVVGKYKKAAEWANAALAHVITLCKPNANIVQICQAGDAFIVSKVNTMHKGLKVEEGEKGIGFPTTLSVNSCVAYQSDVPGEEATADRVLALNDIVHIDLGVHIDGYTAMVANTYVVTANGELSPESREAAIIAAAAQTLDVISRSLRPGTDAYKVTEIIEKCCEHFGFQHCDGVLSHQLKRYIVDGFQCIPGKNSAEHKVHSYEIQPASVWAIEVALTTGRGKLREGDARAGIYKRNMESQYVSKLAAAQELYKEFDKNFGVFPFALRNIKASKMRLGIADLIKHNHIFKYAPLHERDGEVVAHFKITVLVTDKKIERVTSVNVQKGCPAPKPFAADSELFAASKQPFSLVAKKPAAAAAAAAAIEAKK